MTITRYPSLANEVIFITGGATGIGASMVTSFAEQGAQVAFIDIDEVSARRLQETVAKAYGKHPWYQQIDVTDVDALQTAIEQAITTLGKPPLCLINNVANDTRHTPLEVTEKSWHQCLAVNLDAAFFASQAVFPHMRKSERGSIINFSSINAILGPKQMPGYVTAKAGLLGMSKALARDFGESGIRVNSILPGWTVTERQLDRWLTPEAEAQWMKEVAIKTRLMPSDVANLALFLASDDSSMITGQSFVIDGGRT